MPKTTQALWQEMEDAKHQADVAMRNFLQATGWEYSCNHPDCCWRWTKQFEGRTYSFATDEAVAFETRVSSFGWPETDD